MTLRSYESLVMYDHSDFDIEQKNKPQKHKMALYQIPFSYNKQVWMYVVCFCSILDT